MKKSWRTTLFGAGGAAPILFDAVNKLLDGDPSTNPDWNVVVLALGALFALWNARDKNVSSEDQGVK